MAGLRTELQGILEGILGSRNVYFQPPESLKLRYPCIVYEREGMPAMRADNILYSVRKRYAVTVIGRDPDSEIPDRIAALPYCTLNRHFVADNLNHDVFTLYF